jgi:glycerate dehydrogenase
MKIVVLDGYTLNPGDNPWDPIRALGELVVFDRSNAQETLERSRDADILITTKTPIPAQAIAQLPKLKFVAVVATGYNIVDVQAAKQRGIPVANVPEYGTNTVAQFVFALLLELCHHVGEPDRSVHAGEWSKNPDFSYWKRPLIELDGKTMGIVGFGRIGRRVGELASAFRMRVLATPGRTK